MCLVGMKYIQHNNIKSAVSSPADQHTSSASNIYLNIYLQLEDQTCISVHLQTCAPCAFPNLRTVLVYPVSNLRIVSDTLCISKFAHSHYIQFLTCGYVYQCLIYGSKNNIIYLNKLSKPQFIIGKLTKPQFI